LEDLKHFNQALEYIATLDFYEAEKNFKKYGKILVSNIPEQTTALLMKLCSNYTPSGPQPVASPIVTPISSPSVAPKENKTLSPEDRDRAALFVSAFQPQLIY
jgi:hypothetical protein